MSLAQPGALGLHQLPSSYKGPSSKSSHQPEHDQPHRGQREPGSRSFYLETIEITPGHNFLAKVKKTPKLNFSGVKEWKVDTAQLLALPQFFIRIVIYRLT